MSHPVGRPSEKQSGPAYEDHSPVIDRSYRDAGLGRTDDDAATPIRAQAAEGRVSPRLASGRSRGRRRAAQASGDAQSRRHEARGGRRRRARVSRCWRPSPSRLRSSPKATSPRGPRSTGARGPRARLDGVASMLAAPRSSASRPAGRHFGRRHSAANAPSPSRSGGAQCLVGELRVRARRRVARRICRPRSQSSQRRAGSAPEVEVEHRSRVRSVRPEQAVRRSLSRPVRCARAWSSPGHRQAGSTRAAASKAHVGREILNGPGRRSAGRRVAGDARSSASNVEPLNLATPSGEGQRRRAAALADPV